MPASEYGAGATAGRRVPTRIAKHNRIGRLPDRHAYVDRHPHADPADRNGDA